jgi:hypothetical protein
MNKVLAVWMGLVAGVVFTAADMPAANACSGGSPYYCLCRKWTNTTIWGTGSPYRRKCANGNGWCSSDENCTNDGVSCNVGYSSPVVNGCNNNTARMTDEEPVAAEEVDGIDVPVVVTSADQVESPNVLISDEYWGYRDGINRSPSAGVTNQCRAMVHACFRGGYQDLITIGGSENYSNCIAGCQSSTYNVGCWESGTAHCESRCEAGFNGASSCS